MIIKSVFLKASVRLGRNECIVHKHIPVRNTIIYIDMYLYLKINKIYNLCWGAHLKKMRRAEGGAKIVGVFRVKNHDFTPKYHIYSNFGGRGARRLRPWTCLLHYTCKTTN
jgi:hypothetical protein